MSDNKIKILIIDDSVLIRKYVTQVLSEIPGVEVIGTAPNGKIGLKKVLLYRPDFVILDIEMPEMNGLEFLRYLDRHPLDYHLNIIILSSIAGENNTITFEALSLGAHDFITKPQGKISENINFLRKELELKIRALHDNRLFSVTGHSGIKEETQPLIDPAWAKHGTEFGISQLGKVLNQKQYTPRLLAVGSSTGGPLALRAILKTLEPTPIPTLIAQHMPPGFTREFANNLCAIYNRDIREAVEGEILEDGVIYICPGGYHSRLFSTDKGLTITCDPHEIEGFFFKPSVDIFFESISRVLENQFIGLILSGMGKDGSEQARIVRKKGALMLAQDKESSVVWGMPGNAVKSGGVDIILPLDELGLGLNQCLKRFFP